MKKFKLFSGIFAAAVLLTGCATVSDVVGRNGNAVYFDDIVYNQGQVVEVGDYIYYGNGYFDITSSDFNYAESAKDGYISRVKNDDRFSFDSAVEDEYKTSTTPNGVEKVNDKLAGYKNQYMFALGSYIYFTSANTHKTSSLANDYTQVSLFRVKFNGDGFEEFGTYKHDDSSVITAQKGSDNNYYLIITEPTEDSTYNLYSIKIGDELGSEKQLNKYVAEGEDVVDSVETFVICDQTSTNKNIVYTIKSLTSGLETTEIKAVDFATGAVSVLDNGTAGSKTKLLGRDGDTVFYSYQFKAINEVYYKTLGQGDNIFNPTGNKFYNASAIKNIVPVGEGYAFIASSSGSLMYKTLDIHTDAKLLLTSSDFSDVLFADGDYVYLSTSTNINRINVLDNSEEQIVEMGSIISGQCGYDGNYLYFYAKLEEKAEDVEDDNYYMYRTDKLGNYQLIGKAK